ncbi:hypothetical protein BY996DRAFT_6427459 [Phakopsora pachyrhizi]|nr:hypothetical protein BY996DRAFT_6427459 [Phakopsora pachyrhizi]
MGREGRSQAPPLALISQPPISPKPTQRLTCARAWGRIAPSRPSLRRAGLPGKRRHSRRPSGEHARPAPSPGPAPAPPPDAEPPLGPAPSPTPAPPQCHHAQLYSGTTSPATGSSWPPSSGPTPAPAPPSPPSAPAPDPGNIPGPPPGPPPSPSPEPALAPDPPLPASPSPLRDQRRLRLDQRRPLRGRQPRQPGQHRVSPPILVWWL